MSKVYDNWERLVEATLKRENLRQIALAPSFRSSISDDSSEIYPSISDVRGDLGRTILLADELIKAADTAVSFPQECMKLKFKTIKLAGLLRQAMDFRIDLYEQPPRRLIHQTNNVLYKALNLVLKRRGLVKLVFNITSAEAFRRISSQLENSISDIFCIVRIFGSLDYPADMYLGLPCFAAIEPILCLIWEQIAILTVGSTDDRSYAAAAIISLARDNKRFGTYIVEQGGVVPLLKLLEEGELEGQENAARAVGLLGQNPDNVEHMIHAGVCLVFEKILKEGATKVQAVVAWAVSELAMNYPKCQDIIAQHNIVMLLVRHLSSTTLQVYRLHGKTTLSVNASVVLPNNNNNCGNDGSNDSVIKGSNVDGESHMVPALENKQSNQIHDVVTSNMALKGGSGVIESNDNNDAMLTSVHDRHHPQSLTLFGASNRAREMEDPAAKAHIKAMAARALRYLAKGNSSICQSIAESTALPCLAILLEIGPEEVQHDCAMALMELTTMAEEDSDLRTSAFKLDSPVAKAVVDQFISVIDKADNSKLLVPCVKAVGNLTTFFTETEKRMISPLVKLLNHEEVDVSTEACIALKKFACSTEHSKAIIVAGGAEHAIQLVYFGIPVVQRCATVLLCCLALQVPDIEELAQTEVFNVLKWAEMQVSLMRDKEVEEKLILMFQFRRHH